MPIQFDLKPSKILACLFVGLHVGAIGLVACLPIDPVVALFVVFCVCASLTQLVYEAKKPTRVVSLVWGDSGEWQLIRRDAQSVPARLLPSSVVHPWLTVLRFQTSRRWCRESVVIVADMLSDDAFRRLRVHLKVATLSETG